MYNVVIYIEGLETNEEYREWLAANPVSFVYKLTTSEEFQAEGKSAITALDGINTILTDANSVTVTARKDPVHLFDSLKG